jgi:hypothetical protein
MLQNGDSFDRRRAKPPKKCLLPNAFSYKNMARMAPSKGFRRLSAP